MAAADQILIFAGQSNMVGLGTVNTTLPAEDRGVIPRVKGFYTNAVDNGNGPERQGESVYNEKGQQLDWATRPSATGKIPGGSWQDYEAWKSTWTSNGFTYSKSPGDGRHFGDFWALSLNPGGPFENGALCYKNMVNIQAFGPELRVARCISETRPGDHLYLIKYAVGGSGMARWTPPNGDCYLAMKAWISCARESLPPTAQVAGFFWMQGESDALNGKDATRYQERLSTLVTQIRSDTGTPALPVVIGKTHPGLPGEASYAVAWGKWSEIKGSLETVQTVRQAQSAIAVAMPGVKTVETEDLTVLTQEWLDTKNDKIAVLKDTVAIHLDQKGILTLGDRMAAAWQSLSSP